MTRKNVMRKFRIGEISAVDFPCQTLAQAVIFKRAAPGPGTPLEPIQAPDGDDWSKRRTAALQSLQKLAEDRAAVEGEPVAKAYAAVLETAEGRQLYDSAH